jgi:hypothetical protein
MVAWPFARLLFFKHSQVEIVKRRTMCEDWESSTTTKRERHDDEHQNQILGRGVGNGMMGVSHRSTRIFVNRDECDTTYI